MGLVEGAGIEPRVFQIYSLLDNKFICCKHSLTEAECVFNQHFNPSLF